MIVRLILDSGADVDVADHGCARALREATINHQLPQLELVSSLKTDIDAYTTDGKTALHPAVRHNDIQAFKTLLRLGADATRCTKKGTTILHIAAAFSNMQTMLALAEMECLKLNAEHTSRDGSTAWDLLGSNPYYSAELRSSFVRLVDAVSSSPSGALADEESDEEDVFEDASTTL